MPHPHFARLAELPPYVLGVVDARLGELRRAGQDVFDFGLGNPDHGPMAEALARMLESAAVSPASHRYQASPGVAELRQAICRRYQRHHGVLLDPEREAVVTIGSKEGISHLLLATVGAGEVVLGPDPCYPIHRFGVGFAGGHYQPVATGPGRDVIADLEAAAEAAPRPPRLLIVNYPHNPTTATVTAAELEAIVRFAERRDLWLLSDLAYADLFFDGPRAPSVLAVDGARERAVEFFTTSKSFNLPGWRCGFCVGNPTLVGALRQMKTYQDYGLFLPLQQGAALALEHGDAFARTMRDLYAARAQALVAGLGRAGWEVEAPRATMFVWAQTPPRLRHLSSVELAVRLLDQARVAVTPGVAFGEAGEGHVRFALVEELPRIEAACQAIGRWLRG